MGRAAWVLTLALTGALLGEGADSPAGLPARGAARGDDPLAYRIGPDDVLQVSVWRNEALSRTVPVRPDGMISLPLVNDVLAGGRTPMELRSELIARLKEYAPAPEVSVIVAEVHSFKVSVVGAVTKPGRYDMRTWVTVLDALALAGGLTEYADRSRIVVLRREPEKTRRMPFDYSKADREGLAAANFLLQPGDIVVVP